MSYIINKSDNTTKVTEIPDGSKDTASTDLTLIGRNYNGFGKVINENFVRLLENFSSMQYPLHPIRGQLWYDSTELKLKVHNGNTFVPVSSASVSKSRPLALGVGDLWYKSDDGQLYFWDGSQPVLVGPTYTASQQLSGFQIKTVTDSAANSQVVTCLYNSGKLLGLFASLDFMLLNAAEISGFTGPAIKSGFNPGNLPNFKFNVTCTTAENLNGFTQNDFPKLSTANTFTNRIKVASDLGITAGINGNASLKVVSNNVILSNTYPLASLQIGVTTASSFDVALTVFPNTKTITSNSSYNVILGKDLTVNGNLTVLGATTNIVSATLTIEDKNIVLARQTGITPTDALASSGGITLRGATSHAIVWSNTVQAASLDSAEAIAGGYSDSLPALAPAAWNSTEHFNLASGKEFRINGVMVLSSNSLGVGITNMPGVTSIGVQSLFQIGPDTNTPKLQFQNNVISSVQNNEDVVISPNGNGNLALSEGTRITGLGDPVSNSDSTNKSYVDTLVTSRSLFLSIDLSDNKSNTYIIDNIINVLFPPAEHHHGTNARVLCSKTTLSSSTVDIGALNLTTAQATGPSGTFAAVTNVTANSASVPAPVITVTRTIKVFELADNVWSLTSSTDLL